jgi:hypothetical protein
VADTQVDQPLKEGHESLYPLGVGNRLSWRALVPKLKQGGKVPLNIHWCNLLAPGDGEARVGVIAFDFEVGVEVLNIRSAS